MPKLDPSNAELLEFIKENVATKVDLELLATKEEIKQAIAPLATKEELKLLATKEDLKLLATKEELRRVELKVDDLLTSVDGLAKNVGNHRTEMAANTAAHRRFDHRDHIFANKLGVNLDQVDADAQAAAPPAETDCARSKTRYPLYLPPLKGEKFFG